MGQVNVQFGQICCKGDQVPQELCWYILSSGARNSQRPAEVPNAVTLPWPNCSCVCGSPFSEHHEVLQTQDNPSATTRFPMPETLVPLTKPRPYTTLQRRTWPSRLLVHPALFPSKRGKVQWQKQQAALKLTDFFLNLKGSWNLIQIPF